MPPANTASKVQALLPFAKMHGLGNDFVLIRQEDLAASSLGVEILADWQDKGGELARTLCDRHFGIGADGFILVSPPEDSNCEVAWTFLNSDGSASDMCGNGLRCLALFHRSNNQEPGNFNVQTNIGAMPVSFKGADQITIDLKEPILESNLIPYQTHPAKKQVVQEIIAAGDTKFTATCLSMGNPHCVIFEPAIAENDYFNYAPQIQNLPEFPQGVNVEFVKVVNRQRAQVIVYERGAGATLACATGAAATLVAGVLENRLDRKATVELPGGNLEVEWAKDNHVRLTGPASFSFNGVIDIAALTWRSDQ